MSESFLGNQDALLRFDPLIKTPAYFSLPLMQELGRGHSPWLRTDGRSLLNFNNQTGIGPRACTGNSWPEAARSERQLRRIEQSGALSVWSLKQLAEAHRMTLDNYLSAMAVSIHRPPKNRANPPTAQRHTT
jgi:hypothetical protein